MLLLHLRLDHWGLSSEPSSAVPQISTTMPTTLLPTVSCYGVTVTSPRSPSAFPRVGQSLLETPHHMPHISLLVSNYLESYRTILESCLDQDSTEGLTGSHDRLTMLKVLAAGKAADLH